MNRKGQALVEFVLILPVFIFLVFAVIDFGTVFNNKNVLENDSSDIINLFKNGESVDKINELYSEYTINVGTDDKYYKFEIEKKIKMITPGASRIFGNPYKIKVVRYVPNE